MLNRWRRLCPSCFDADAEKASVKYGFAALEGQSDKPVPQRRGARRRWRHAPLQSPSCPSQYSGSIGSAGIVAEASQQPESVVTTGSRVWRVLGILLGTATCISLVKNGFAIELHGLPAAILRQYAWLRDMLFEPVVWMLRYFGLTMPWWLKDVIMAYGLMTAVHWRVSGAWKAPLAPRPSEVLFWPLLEIRAIVWRYGWSRSEALLPEWAKDVLSSIRLFHRALVWNIGLILVVASAFFLWSHLQNVVGPGG